MERNLLFAGIAACMLFCSADVFAGGAKGSCSGGGHKSCCANVSHPNTGYFSRDADYLKSNRLCPDNYTSSGESETFHRMFPNPRWGDEVSKRTATKNAFSISHQTGTYFYKDGIFYFNSNDSAVKDKYFIQEPIYGMRVKSLPKERYLFEMPDKIYYYYYGTFYVYDNPANEYVVVAPPIGAIVDWIPSSSQKLQKDNENYCLAGDVLYKVENTESGESYVVVGYQNTSHEIPSE